MIEQLHCNMWPTTNSLHYFVKNKTKEEMDIAIALGAIYFSAETILHGYWYKSGHCWRSLHGCRYKSGRTLLTKFTWVLLQIRTYVVDEVYMGAVTIRTYEFCPFAFHICRVLLICQSSFKSHVSHKIQLLHTFYVFTLTNLLLFRPIATAYASLCSFQIN